MRIGIVNDTGLVREALRRVVLSLPEHEVGWTASDGAEAIALARADPSRSDLDGPVHAGDRWRRGDAADHGRVAVCDPGGHRDGLRASEQGLPGNGLRGTRCDRYADLGPRGEITGAAVLLHKIEIIGKLVGKPAERPRSGRARRLDSTATSSSPGSSRRSIRW